MLIIVAWQDVVLEVSVLLLSVLFMPFRKQLLFGFFVLTFKRTRGF